MRFSQPTHLQMCLSLETLTSIIRTGLPILVILIDLVNSVIIFLFQMTLLRWFYFLLRSPGYDSDSPALLDFSLSSVVRICYTIAIPPLGNSDHVVVSLSIEFQSYSPRFIALLTTNLVQFGCSSPSFERCSMGGHLYTRYFCCC